MTRSGREHVGDVRTQGPPRLGSERRKEAARGRRAGADSRKAGDTEPAGWETEFPVGGEGERKSRLSESGGSEGRQGGRSKRGVEGNRMHGENL